MDPTRIDRIAKMFAERRLNRRRAVQHTAAGLAAAALAATGLTVAAAEDATPVTSATPVTGVGKTEGDAEFLFVQSYRSGGFASKDGSDDTFTLTLSDGADQTVYFSDRPERVVGAAPTETFLERFPFGADDPPNAALVLQTSPDAADVVVMELSAPNYDAATHTATYDAKVLADYDDVDMAFQEQPTSPADVKDQFGSASLFIDSCPNATLICHDQNGQYAGNLGSIVGMCWLPKKWCCTVCQVQDFNAICDNNIAACNGKCTAELDEASFPCT